MIRVGFQSLVDRCLSNQHDARIELHELIVLKNIKPYLSEEEAAYLIARLAMITIEDNPAALGLKGALISTGFIPLSNASGETLSDIYEKGIALNDPIAMCNRVFVPQGNEVYQEDQQHLIWQNAQSLKLIRRAISLGSIYAIRLLGELYRKYGDKKEFPFVAINCFETGIKRNDTYSMRQRASMYQRGEGETDGKPNYIAARKLYRRASDLGDPRSMFYLACLYETGQGDEKGLCDITEAIALLKRSLALGHSKAADKLTDLLCGRNQKTNAVTASSCSSSFWQHPPLPASLTYCKKLKLD